MRKTPVIVLATTNRGKLEEFQSLFAAYPEVSLHSADEYIRNAPALALAEKYSTYLENAAAKARACNHAAHYTSLADDSGIEVLALEGRPGVKSARFGIPRGGQSQDDANVQSVLTELQGKPQRDARLVCTLALVVEGVLLHATGTLDGTIADAPRGTNGFGYDPIFIPRGQTKTFAELSTAEKNQLSHRAQALRSLMEQVRAHGVVFAKP